LLRPKIYIDTFLRNFSVDGKIANLLLATSRCNGIWETTQQTQRTFATTCYGL